MCVCIEEGSYSQQMMVFPTKKKAEDFIKDCQSLESSSCDLANHVSTAYGMYENNDVKPRVEKGEGKNEGRWIVTWDCPECEEDEKLEFIYNVMYELKDKISSSYQIEFLEPALECVKDIRKDNWRYKVEIAEAN